MSISNQIILMHITFLFLLLHFRSCYCIGKPEQSLEPVHQSLYLSDGLSETLEPGQLSRCLVRQRESGNQWVNCIPKASSFETSVTIRKDIELCLRKIEYRSLLGTPVPDEEIVFEYYSCVLNAELAYLIDRRQVSANPNFTIGLEMSIKLSILRAAWTFSKLCILSSVVILWNRCLKSTFWDRRIHTPSHFEWVQRVLPLATNMANVHFLNLETKLVNTLRKLYRRIKKDVKTRKQVNIMESGEEVVTSTDSQTVSEVFDFMENASPACCNDENTDAVAADVQVRKLSVNLTSKGNGLVFDLTTKEGRKEWKAYINRDKGQMLPPKESVLENKAIVNSALMDWTKAEKVRPIELDPALQNVPLYDKHGKPLRRVCVPGIGWISRRKYLEQQL
ncbi:LANO_0H17590g1_1 [Lachancea nothofagi CBS 11611]|uniref:LANO_0H17590g1_1 n=1 Tax=Lachancea nothofagi CBS 11611 TaxID=1266666 RepID=A0A1G4KN95_9SACH|nr:LANO_0H17590g1_1 [Lachancea nothofagi CBS 11611]